VSRVKTSARGERLAAWTRGYLVPGTNKELETYRD